MRKLSITHATGFRGKIQKFIASVFPLSHPACTNRMGALNIKNLTNFEEAKEPESNDYKEYKNFWLLQRFISNPFNVRSQLRK